MLNGPLFRDSCLANAMQSSKKNPLNSADLLAVAQRVLWFEAPEEGLRDPNRFLAYLMTYGSLEDLLIARKYFSDESFDCALRNAPPGVFDIRSWTYWNLRYGHYPTPPLPQRRIPEADSDPELSLNSLRPKK